MVKKKKVTKKRGRKKKVQEFVFDGIKVRKVKLNNKGRKGFYWYIREPKKSSKYFKYKPDISIEEYLNAYKGGIRVKKKGVNEYKTSDAQKYIKKIDKRIKIDNAISKGRSEVIAGNVFYVDRKRVYDVYKEMLKPLVKDNELIRILALDENVRKYKHRIQGFIEIIGENNNYVKINCVGKTIDEIRTDLSEVIKTKMFNEQALNKLKGRKYSLSDTSESIAGYDKNVMIKKIEKVNLKLRYIKGR